MKVQLSKTACSITFLCVITAYGFPQSTPTSEIHSVESARGLINEYCVACHSERAKSSTAENVREAARKLTLDDADVAHVGQSIDLWEKVVRKLRAGMMPPSGVRRPDALTYESMIVWLERELDRSAVGYFPPPHAHRLNRVEYSNAVRDLLGLEIDATKFLPTDDSTRGFDNMAGTLTLSPALLEAYVSAAGKISRLAVGNITAPSQIAYNIPADTSQNYHIEGLPFGTRGGTRIKHYFPAGGEYVLKIYTVKRGNMGGAGAFGGIRGEKLLVLLDGEQLATMDWDEGVRSPAGSGEPGHIEYPVIVKAGLHEIGVTFLATNYAPLNDLNKLFMRSTIETGGISGYTFFPHVATVWIEGPDNPVGAFDTLSRRKIFVCQPQNQENNCAQQIITNLARRAYRTTPTTAELELLRRAYQTGRRWGTFDDGVEMVVRAVLANPRFLYRVESEPAALADGQAYRITDLELASRLSFFLWSSIPDDELLSVAMQGRLKDPAVLEAQTRRMLDDRRSEAFTVNFAGQWLNLRGLSATYPDVMRYPDFDENLRQAMKREVELFFDSVVHENRGVIDLLTANYTFLNERLAKHYGFPEVYGSEFRRVSLSDAFDVRRGLLGKSAFLATTSKPDRTSPVVRGKTVMQLMLGISPPDPPPVVPALEATKAEPGKVLSVRQQTELHRRVEPCASCHKIMDPIGLALENFDAIGVWRTDDKGEPIDPSGQLVDGTHLDGPAALRQALLRYAPQFARTATEKLLTYALGRITTDLDMPVIRAIVRDAEPTHYRFSDLILGVVKSKPFQMNMKLSESPDLGGAAKKEDN